MIEKESGIDRRRIKDVRIFDKFSFISVPFNDAEVILYAFKKLSSRRPLVARARERAKKQP